MANPILQNAVTEAMSGELCDNYIVSLADFNSIQKAEVIQYYVKSAEKYVFLRPPDALRRGLMEGQILSENPQKETQKMQFCALVLCDDAGVYLFPSILDLKKITQVLGPLNSQIVEEIALKVIALTKIDQEVVEERVKK